MAQVKPYTNAWLKDVEPGEYAKGWRMHPKGGLIPPASIKPTKKQPEKCTSCGAKTFHFMATGLKVGTRYWWECNKCGVLHPAR
jgi:ribosomal protein S27AE